MVRLGDDRAREPCGCDERPRDGVGRCRRDHSSTQRYTKELNASVPASTFSGSTGGDGWDVFFYDDYVLNIFHHNSSVHRARLPPAVDR